MSSSLVHTSAIRLLAVGSSLATNLLALKMCDRHLGVGRWVVIAGALQVLTLMPQLDGGFRVAINRALLGQGSAEDRARYLRFGQSFTWWLGLAAMLVGGGVLFLLGFLPNARALGMSLLFFITFGVSGAVNLTLNSQANLLVGLGQQWRLFVVQALTAWVNFAILAVALRSGWNEWAFPAAFAAGVVGIGPLVRIWLRQLAPELPFGPGPRDADFRRTWNELQSRSLAALRFQVYTALLYSVDLVIVSQFCPPDRVSDIYGYIVRAFVIVRIILQAADEALWPRVARDPAEGRILSLALARLNCWLHGAAMAAMALSIGPFLGAFLRSEMTPAPLLAAVLAARGLITGLASQPAFYLYGDGRFGTLARSMGRELFIGVLLGIPAARIYGPTGVAAAFLLGTLGGTAWPLLRDYSIQISRPAGELVIGFWMRAVPAGMVAGLVGWALLPQAVTPFQHAVCGGLAAAAGLSAGVVFAMIGSKQSAGPIYDWRNLVRRM
ncbi:MAG: hypothetical protein EXS36_07365 [Pedosphaera sp.]|nr:hypothetical protein [Pedosphaera sp.]